MNPALNSRVAGTYASIGQLHAALDYHLERQNILSSNVAHLDTPGYRPSDLRRVDESFASVLSTAMQRTNEAHLTAGDLGKPVRGEVFQDLSSGVGNDGNYVSLDREAAKLAANQLRYDVVSAIVSAEIRQLSYAASDAKG